METSSTSFIVMMVLLGLLLAVLLAIVSLILGRWRRRRQRRRERRREEAEENRRRQDTVAQWVKSSAESISTASHFSLDVSGAATSTVAAAFSSPPNGDTGVTPPLENCDDMAVCEFVGGLGGGREGMNPEESTAYLYSLGARGMTSLEDEDDVGDDDPFDHQSDFEDTTIVPPPPKAGVDLTPLEFNSIVDSDGVENW